MCASGRFLRFPLLLLGLFLTLPAAAQQPIEPFTVMTYNIRHVTGADSGKFTWTAREASVLALIRKRNPDVFGIQECSSDNIKDAFVREFDADYDRYQHNNGSPKSIFFRRSRFTRADKEVAEGTFYFANPYPESDKCFENARWRTASWVWIRDKESLRDYLVINMHLAHSSCVDARTQAAVKVREFIEQQSPESVIVFGDLNVDDTRSSESTIKTMEAERAGLRLFRTAQHSGATTQATATYNNGWKTTGYGTTRLDYIFVGGEEVDSMNQLVDQSKANGISPSDHFPVMATIRQGLFKKSATKAISPPSTGLDVSFGDVNGDGAADQVIYGSALDDGRPQVHLSLRNGTFSAEALASESGALAADGSQFYYADVNGDFCDDELSWNPAQDSGALFVALSNCDGTFSQASAQAGPSDLRSEHHFSDIDGDGCDDWLTWSPSQQSGRTRVALSSCDGAFLPEVTNMDEGASTNFAAHVYLADFDGDGAADKLVWDENAQGGKTQLYRSNRDGSFSFHTLHSGGYSGVASTKYYFGDINGDGFADKIFWRDSFRKGHPQIYMGTANGFVGAPVMGNQGVSAVPSTRHFLADIDGNGSADLITWDRSRDGADIVVNLALVDGSPPTHDDPKTIDSGIDSIDGGDHHVRSDAGATATPERSSGEGLSSGCRCRVEVHRSSTTCALLGTVFLLLRQRRRYY